MKKILFGIIAVIMTLGMLTSCAFSSDIGSDDNSISVLPNDSTEFEDLYADIDEAHVTEYSAKEIQSTYLVMCDKLNKSTSTYNNFDIERLQNATPLTSKKVAYIQTANLHYKEQQTPAISEMNPERDIIPQFFTLKNYVEKKFDEFCNNYAIIGGKTLARVKINDSLHELELSVRKNNTYFFFSAYFLNEKGQKHFIFQEGDFLFIEYHVFTYSVKDGQINFPINYTYGWKPYNVDKEHNDITETLDTGNTYYYTITSSDDYELFDINIAYTIFKYPYIKYVDSKIFQTLINCKSTTEEAAFRNAIDKTINNCNFVGETEVWGNDISYDKISGHIEDEKFIPSKNEFHIKSVSQYIFSLSNSGLFLSVSARLTKTDINNNEPSIPVNLYYSVDKGVHKEDGGVYFELNTDVDLAKYDYLTNKYSDDNQFGSLEDKINDGYTLTLDVNNNTEYGIDYCLVFLFVTKTHDIVPIWSF